MPIIGGWSVLALASRLDRREDSFNVINAATPGSATGQLQICPKPCVVGQRGVWRQIFPGGATGQNPCSFFWRETFFIFADQVNASFNPFQINVNLDGIAIQNFSQWPSRQALGTDMTDARA